MIHKIESSMHVALAAMSAPPVSWTTYAVPAFGTASLDSTTSFEHGINGSSSARTAIYIWWVELEAAGAMESSTTYAVPAFGTASLDSTRSFEHGINGSSSARTAIYIWWVELEAAGEQWKALHMLFLPLGLLALTAQQVSSMESTDPPQQEQLYIYGGWSWKRQESNGKHSICCSCLWDC
ncbi:hypothetical protein OPV22_004167 [Ensete ventricosum]|uniref:Uncharacterized protein n=1 Tax=Ensete ventricosum TaxID=4639 RepID=A0AAV8S2T7_ENSVE|nr:hypothetical protein OPV22_004167 [Ensete ventricosum]